MRIRKEQFTIAKTFPPDDHLAIDLLRLMAGYNDLALIIEWQEAHLKEPEDFYETTWAAGRFDLQVRLLRAIMYEILKVIDELEKLEDFQKLKTMLTDEGKLSLERLHQVSAGKDSFGKRLLALTRNTTAYHYDRNLFKHALKRLITRYSGDADTNLLFIEDRFGHEQYYFSVADFVRVEIVEGLTGEGGTKELETLMELTRAFGSLLEDLLVSYTRLRGLPVNFALR